MLTLLTLLTISDVVDLFDIVDIVDCRLLKQPGTRLSSIEAISKTLLNQLINQSMSIMGLRDANPSKNNQ